MKIKITTIYENVDQPWLDWYLKSLERQGELKGARVAEQLRESQVAVFQSDDPSSEVTAETKYEVLP